jgi:excinuclease ABC subunit A
MPKITKPSNQTYIHLKGARVHNLKNIELMIPKNKLIVITGLSGSGKSSLAFDTLYAEGQRRYIESLSSYARQFLGKLEKPEVDFIKGISPAIAIEQKVTSRNPRSTVGTSTEIYDYIKLLYARIGKTISPISGDEVKKDTTEDVLTYVKTFNDNDKLLILAPYTVSDKKELDRYLNNLRKEGVNRIKIDGEVSKIEDVIENPPKSFNKISIVIDRAVYKENNAENDSRLFESIKEAFEVGKGVCEIEQIEGESKTFSNKFELDGIVFTTPHEHLFSFNNPLGACPKCQGYGKIIGVDEDLVLPNKNLSVYEEAIACWKGEKMSEWKNRLVLNAHKFNFPVHTPLYDLTDKELQLLWDGNKYFEGLTDFFQYVESQSYKIQYRIMLSRYRGKTKCDECNGGRLKKESTYIKVNNTSITKLVDISINKCLDFFKNITLSKNEEVIARRILREVISRLEFLLDVGLGYLTLNRMSATLSGGESQRINLATSLGSSLVGSMYILDEPSIGLHSKDTERLIKVLKSLRDIGNTVIVVEHDEDIMREADLIIDMGPYAGTNGGEVVFQGVHEELLNEELSLTAKYLTGREVIEIPAKRREWSKSINFLGCRENNLKNIDVEIPLDIMTVITGVSGSGKSTLVKQIIYPALKKIKGGHASKTGDFKTLSGNYNDVEEIEFIDQNPIGKSSRSNPATYVKAYDDIRALFANLQASKVNGYKPKHFSFNTEGGRCESCNGDGYFSVNMQFMADVELVCDECKGKRFKEEVLEVKYKEKSIYDVLEMTLDDALAFFKQDDNTTTKKIVKKLLPLQKVGLGYIKLGQSSSTLSGGEAQRIKLGSFLSKENNQKKTLFIFDEPTTGLHFHDIKKLLYAFNALVEKGHTLVVIEHNMDVIKCADWIIDLGVEGGDLGGDVIFKGVPEDLILNKQSLTSSYLKDKLKEVVLN